MFVLLMSLCFFFFLLVLSCQGAVQEWDLLQLKPASSLDAAGGAVWCMKASPHRSLLAAGCEDGRVSFLLPLLLKRLIINTTTLKSVI